MELMSSTMPCHLICVSGKKNTTGWGPVPASRMMRLSSSCHSGMPKLLESSIWISLYPAMKVASLVAHCLPEPPTPTSSEWPPGILRTRAIRETCSRKKRKGTRSMGLLVWELNSSSDARIWPTSTEASCASTYGFFADSERKSPQKSRRTSSSEGGPAGRSSSSAAAAASAAALSSSPPSSPSPPALRPAATAARTTRLLRAGRWDRMPLKSLPKWVEVSSRRRPMTHERSSSLMRRSWNTRMLS
mmetsp:Transcript_17181/g.65159  ORF Transcript_17181/g.65159 Transcript_17181/m.65159 type:complete len:246 (-) Transcript_17181:1928-2665(-)